MAGFVFVRVAHFATFGADLFCESSHALSDAVSLRLTLIPPAALARWLAEVNSFLGTPTAYASRFLDCAYALNSGAEQRVALSEHGRLSVQKDARHHCDPSSPRAPCSHASPTRARPATWSLGTWRCVCRYACSAILSMRLFGRSVVQVRMRGPRPYLHVAWK
jgi:hypothetical protein